MWREVLGLALLVSLNPMLLGLILLVISRPRPVQNLLAFWVGAVIVNVPCLLAPLFALHLVPSFGSFAHGLATPDPDSGIKPLQLGTGVFALAIAALIALRARARQRAKQPVLSGRDGKTAVLLMDSDTPATEARQPGRVREALAGVGSRFKQLFSRLHDEWENGALWVALVFGLGYLPPPPLVLLVDTVIVASGEPIGTQIVVVIAFVFAMLAVLEIALLSYVVAPAKTQAVLEPVHEWAHAHRQQVLLVLFLAVGMLQLVAGFGIL